MSWWQTRLELAPGHVNVAVLSHSQFSWNWKIIYNFACSPRNYLLYYSNYRIYSSRVLPSQFILTRSGWVDLPKVLWFIPPQIHSYVEMVRGTMTRVDSETDLLLGKFSSISSRPKVDPKLQLSLTRHVFSSHVFFVCFGSVTTSYSSTDSSWKR
jgi:hypothetical protein